MLVLRFHNTLFNRKNEEEMTNDQQTIKAMKNALKAADDLIDYLRLQPCYDERYGMCKALLTVYEHEKRDALEGKE